MHSEDAARPSAPCRSGPAAAEALERALRDAKERPVLEVSDIGVKPEQSASSDNKSHHPFSELTEDWSPDRRRRVEHIKAKHEQDVKATADEAAASTDAPNWEELEAAVLELDEADAQAFAEALLNPPEPRPRLRKAAQRHKKFVAGKSDAANSDSGGADK